MKIKYCGHKYVKSGSIHTSHGVMRFCWLDGHSSSSFSFSSSVGQLFFSTTSLSYSYSSNGLKASGSRSWITATTSSGDVVDARSNSKAGGGRWGRNPTPSLMMSCSYKRRFPRFSFSGNTSNGNNDNKNDSNGNTPAKFDWNIPDAYKDRGDLPHNHDTDGVTGSDGDLDDAYSSDDIEIEIKETGNNCRRIQSRVSVDASLQTVWNILTDYEKLTDFIPALAVSQLIQKTDNFARILQIGQQNLAFGLKFKAKGIIDCYEKDIQNLSFGQRRDIEFKMIEGDFQLFQGKWSVEQISKGKYELPDSITGQEFHTTLSYVVDVQPKVWLPVRLVQGRLCREIKMNLLCIKIAAERAIHNEVSPN